MVEFIYLLAEMLSVVMCIFNLCGKKIKVNINLIILLLLNVVYIMGINAKFISRSSAPIIYVLMFFYLLLEFKYKLINTACICIMAIVIITMLQMIVFFPASLLCYLFDEDITVLAINVVVLLIVIGTRKLSIYKKLNNMCKIKELKISVCVGAIIIFTGYYLYLIKVKNKVEMDSYITCLVLIVMTMYLILKWQKSNNEIALKEKQIEVVRKCRSSFENLIDITRKNQHDLKNHIIAIAGMHNTINTYEELVDEQRKYIGEIQHRNEYSKVLLGINEPILAGYLFNKLLYIRKYNIEIEHKVSVFSDKIKYISIFDLNEIIGILLDNAYEAVRCEEDGNRRICLEIEETNNNLKICVANISKYISKEQIIEMFKSGKSTKGKNRGLGLSKIKEYQGQYGFDILVENKERENKNWIYFIIIIKKSLKGCFK